MVIVETFDNVYLFIHIYIYIYIYIYTYVYIYHHASCLKQGKNKMLPFTINTRICEHLVMLLKSLAKD